MRIAECGLPNSELEQRTAPHRVQRAAPTSWRARFEKAPLTLPSPARGEGKYKEVEKVFASPLRGEGEGGGDLRNYFTASQEAVVVSAGSNS